MYKKDNFDFQIDLTFKSNNLKILPIDPIKKSEVALFASLKRKQKIMLDQNKSFFKKLSINLLD